MCRSIDSGFRKILVVSLNTIVIAKFGRQHTLGHVPHGIYEAYMRKSQKKPGTEVTVVIQSSTTVFSSVLQYFQKCSKKYVEMQ